MKNTIRVLIAALIMAVGTFFAVVVSIATRCLFDGMPFPMDYALLKGARSSLLIGSIAFISFLISCRKTRNGNR